MDNIFECEAVCNTLSKILSQHYGCKVVFAITPPDTDEHKEAHNVSINQSTQSTGTNMLTVEQVAEKLSVSEFIVRKWLRDGKMQGTKLCSSKLWRVSESQLKEFLLKNSNLV